MKQWILSLFPNIRDAAIRWNEDDASSFAASVAYYMALSLFPILVLLTSILGLVLEFTEIGHSTDRQIQELLDTIANNGSEQLAATLRDIISQLRLHSVIACPSALMATMFAASKVFTQIDRGFDRIWRVTPEKHHSVHGKVKHALKSRLGAFTMLLSLGGAIVLVFIANMVFSQFRSITGKTLPTLTHVFGAADLLFTIVTNAFLFGAAYRFLPKKRVGWREAWRGGLLAAVVWELGRIVLGMFFIGMRYTSAYGALGSFIAILLWCYYGISIFYFGAEYVQVLQNQKQRRSQEDSTSALRIGTEGEPASQPMLSPATVAVGVVETSVRQIPRRVQRSFPS